MSFDGVNELYQYGRAETEQKVTLYPCAYCKRHDAADYAGNCQGCGAPKRPVSRLDVTTLCSTGRQYVYIEE